MLDQFREYYCYPYKHDFIDGSTASVYKDAHGEYVFFDSGKLFKAYIGASHGKDWDWTASIDYIGNIEGVDKEDWFISKLSPNVSKGICIANALISKPWVYTFATGSITFPMNRKELNQVQKLLNTSPLSNYVIEHITSQFEANGYNELFFDMADRSKGELLYMLARSESYGKELECARKRWTNE